MAEAKPILREPSIVLELDANEARYLKALTQNYLGSSCEDAVEGLTRESICKALNKAGVK